MNALDITPALLRQYVEYDPVAGYLKWKPRGQGRFDTKLAGRPAFSQPSGGYLIGRIGGVNLKAHRVAWAIHYGQWPDGPIDHINGNGCDNAIGNLRCVTERENARNRGRDGKNTSGEPCISWYARNDKWQVKVTANRQQKHVGFFDDLESAVAARNQAWKENGFHPNHGRTRILSALKGPTP